MCDPQLFQEHVSFWEAGLKVRTLEMMIPIYHDICGRGMVMELDFAIDRRGLVPDSHAAVYAQLGEWVRGCYGSPVAMSSGQGGEYVVTVQAGQVLDRFQLKKTRSSASASGITRSSRSLLPLAMQRRWLTMSLA